MKQFLLSIFMFCCMISDIMAQSKGFEVQNVEPQFRNVNYASDSLEAHNMDIYLPKTGQENYKVVVAIYGSAWFSNNMKCATFYSLGKPLVNAGFAVACLNHRSSTEARFPAQLHDVKAAIRYLRAHAEEYKLDTTFIGITGFSSGGHLAAMVGVSNGMKQRTEGITTIDVEGNVGGNLNFSSKVDAVVDWFGPVDMSRMQDCSTVKDEKSPEAVLMGGAPADLPDMVRLISPISYVSKECTPFLVIHGNADNVVPHCQSIFFSEVLQAAGRLNELIIVPEGKHGPKTFNDETFGKIVDFFKECSAKLVVGEVSVCH